jgi:hypothetical protein
MDGPTFLYHFHHHLLLRNLAHPANSIASHAFPKDIKAQEPNPRKGKKISHSFDSNQSKTSSHSFTSHSLHPGHEDIHVSFGDMHPNESKKKGKMPTKAGSQVLKVTKSQESGQRQTTSHKKYDF